MADSILKKLDLDTASAMRVWSAMDRETRTRAAQAFYDVEDGDREIQRGADKIIADAIRFRLPTVRKLPVAKKIHFLAGNVRPEEPLATMILQAHHLHYNRDLLGAFLDALGIAHERGHIKDDVELESPTADKLAPAAKGLYEKFDAAEVDLYLASLFAMEGDIWGGLRDFLEERSKA